MISLRPLDYSVQARVKCEKCGHLHVMERRIYQPERLSMVCHGCETVMGIVITEAHIQKSGVRGR